MNFLTFEVSEELIANQEFASWLYSIFMMVNPVLLAVGILLPIIVIKVSRSRRIKALNPSSFGPDGSLLTNNVLIKNTFKSIVKMGDLLIFVAQDNIKKATITLVTYSNKRKVSYLDFDFTKGKMVSIPIRENVEQAAIVVDGANGNKSGSDESANPSGGALSFAAIFPTLCAAIACASGIIVMLIYVSDEGMQYFNPIYLYAIAGASILGLPLSFAWLFGIRNHVAK